MRWLRVPGNVPYKRLAGFYFFYFAFLGAWAPYWNLYLDDLGLSAKAIGTLAAIVMLTKVVAPSVWGFWADRSGQRLAIIRFGALMASLVFTGFLLKTAWMWLLILTLLYSFFWNAILAQFEVVTLDHLEAQAHFYSRIRLWGSVGFVLAVGGLGFLFDYIEIANLPVLLWCLLLGVWLSSLSIPGLQHQESHPDTANTAELKQILLQPSILGFMVCCFLLQIAHGSYYTFFSLYLEQHDYSRSTIGVLWALGVLAEIILFMFMHRVLARYSLRWIVLMTFILAAVRWLIIAWWVDQLWLLCLAQLTHAATFGAFHAVSMEFIRRNFSADHQGQGQAIYSGISFGGGGALGAFVSGWIWEWDPVYSFYMASLACLLAWCIAYRYWPRNEALMSQSGAA